MLYKELWEMKMVKGRGRRVVIWMAGYPIPSQAGYLPRSDVEIPVKLAGDVRGVPWGEATSPIGVDWSANPFLPPGVAIGKVVDGVLGLGSDGLWPPQSLVVGWLWAEAVTQLDCRDLEEVEKFLSELSRAEFSIQAGREGGGCAALVEYSKVGQV
jgi:hypothetical protein